MIGPKKGGGVVLFCGGRQVEALDMRRECKQPLSVAGS